MFIFKYLMYTFNKVRIKIMKKHKKSITLFIIIFLMFSLHVQLIELEDNQKNKKIDTYIRPNSSSVLYEWHRIYSSPGSEIGKAVATDASGNIYIAATRENDAIFLLKYNSEGDYQWRKIWNTPGRDVAGDIAVDSLGNIFVVGSTYIDSINDLDTILIKYNNNGVKEWEQTWNYDDYWYGSKEYGKAIAIDSSDNIYVAGSSVTPSMMGGGEEGDGVALILKYNSSGDLQWSYRGGWRDYNSATGIVVDSRDDIYIGGYCYIYGYTNKKDMCYARFDKDNGNCVYAPKFDGDLNNAANDIAIDSNNNIYLVGYYGNNISTVKCSHGTFQWDITWGGNDSDVGYSVAIDSFDNIYISGETNSFGEGQADMCLLKYNSSGDLKYYEVWGDILDEKGHGISLVENDCIYIGGIKDSIIDGMEDVCLLKYVQLPEDQYISINNDEEITCINLVNLTLFANYANEMCFRNGTTGTWSTWELYNTTKQLNLAGSENNTEYSISVKFKNSYGESEPVSDSILYLLIPPTQSYISINNDAVYTSFLLADLTLSALFADEMCFKNASADIWTDWEPYKNTKQLFLEYNENNTVNNIFVRFRNSNGECEPVNDSILLWFFPPVDLSISINNGAEYTNCTFVTLWIHASSASEMRFKNSSSSCWSVWEPYSTLKSVRLINTENNTVNTIDAMFRNSTGISKPVSDNILFLFYTPLEPYISINNGSETFSTLPLQLTLSAIGSKEMCLKIGALGYWSEWEPFQIIKWLDIDNPQNNTIYTIYVKFRNEFAETTPVNDSILYLRIIPSIYDFTIIIILFSSITGVIFICFFIFLKKRKK